MAMPSRVSWPVMGGPTAHPTGVTLTSGDPPNSLNAPGGALTIFCRGKLENFASRVLWLAGAVSSEGWSGRGSGMQSSPLRRIGSSGEASFPAVSVVTENMAFLPRNLDTNDGQAGREVAER